MNQKNSSFKTITHKLQAWILDQLAHRCSTMSQTGRQRLARLISYTAFNVVKIRRKQVVSSIQEHLQLSMPEAEKLGEKTYYSFLLNAFEMAGLKYLSNEQLHNKFVVTGLENLDQALARKKGVILISGHFGLWELVDPWLAINGYNATAVVRRQNNIYVDKWFEEMRQHHGARTTDSGYGLREILKALRSGYILGLMVDQDNGKQGIFVKFLNRWASAPTGPAQIALKTGAPIVPVAAIPDFKGKHLLRFFPAIIPGDFSADLAGQQQLTTRYTQIIAELVKMQPQNWFWFHRRWKTQPEDAPDNEWAKLINSALTTDPKQG